MNANQNFQAMLQGESEGLQFLLQEYHNYMVVVGMRYLNDRQRVEDVIHDIFADLWNCGRKVDIQYGVKSYLRGSVINKCLSIIRKEDRIDLVEEHSFDLQDGSFSVVEEIDAAELKKRIDELVYTLPPKCRAVFIKSRLEGKSQAEIAEELSISKKTIENHMSKALKILKNGLKDRELMILVLIFLSEVGANTI